MQTINFKHLIPFILLFASCVKGVEYIDQQKPEVVLDAAFMAISADVITLHSDTTYVLAENLVREAGQELVIEPGTLIKVHDRLGVYIQSGAVINAVGTATNPIVFTTFYPKAGAGANGGDGAGTHYWNGIRIYGNSVIDPDDVSGVLQYVRIEFAGWDESFSGLPALLFQYVGNGTKVDHIQVSYSFISPSFAFVGGNLDAKQLVSYASAGNDFQLEGGYKGRLQFLLAYRHPYFPAAIVGSNLAGMLVQDDGTDPVVSNLSVIGPVSGPNSSLAYSIRYPSSALVVQRGAFLKIRNSVLAGFPRTAFFVNDFQSAQSFDDRVSLFEYNCVQAASDSVFFVPDNIFPPFSYRDMRDFFLISSFGNRIIDDFNAFGYNRPFDYDANPDPLPGEQSFLQTGADFNQPVFQTAFFEPVPFVGATGSAEWLEGWIDWKPLQSDY